MFSLELVRPVGLHAVAPRVDDLVAADAPHLATEAARAVEAAVARPEAQPGRDGLVAVIPVAAVSAVKQLNQFDKLNSG